MNKKVPYIVFVLLGLVFAVLPTQNAMIDSWYFATCVKYKMELFNSHHLLYNVFGYYWFYLLRLLKPSIEAISALNLMSAFAGTVSLFLLYSSLLKLKSDKTTSFLLTCFCATSFGFMRYTTDAETYILPIMFSLLATYYIIDYRNKVQLFSAGFFATIAIMVHQLHLWWALAMFIFLLMQRPFSLKKLLLFTCPLLLIPVAYYTAFMSFNTGNISFMQFIAGEYGKGNASLNVSLFSLLVTSVSFFRTFFQVHGNIGVIFSQYTFISIVIAIMCIIWILYNLFNEGFKLVFIPTNHQANYSKLFLIAFCLHLTFAFLSSGNAEFMVMLPFLMVLFFGSKYKINKSGLITTLTVLMGLWNLSFAVVPNAVLNITQVNKQLEFLKKYPDAFFFWKNKPLVENVFTYQYGFNKSINFIGTKVLDRRMIDSLLIDNKTICTDLPNSNVGFNREWLLGGIEAGKILKQFHLKRIDSFENLYGKNYIYLIQKRAD